MIVIDTNLLFAPLFPIRGLSKQVKFNNERTRDFTRELPAAEPGHAPPRPIGVPGATTPMAAPVAAVTYSTGGPQYGAPVAVSQGFAGYAPAAAPAVAYSNVGAMGGMQMAVPPMGGLQQHGGGQRRNPHGEAQTTPVIMVNNLDESRVTADTLYTLFGAYGNVMRVKIMFKKRSSAFVELENVQQAAICRQYLDGVPLYGQNIQINTSRHQNVRIGPLDNNVALARDYTSAVTHRFAFQNSNNFKHICTPSPNLHLSNIPDGTSAEAIQALFASYGTVTGFKFFVNSSKMAVLQMATLGEAVMALIHLHNHSMGESNLKVSFSKSEFH